jgi:hypothetical protein
MSFAVSNNYSRDCDRSSKGTPIKHTTAGQGSQGATHALAAAASAAAATSARSGMLLRGSQPARPSFHSTDAVVT